MGTQTGVIRIRGKVGNLSFAKTPNGDEVRLKTSITGDKMRKDKRFKRTRENWAEFADATKAAKLIRNAFSLSAKSLQDRLAYSRLVKQTIATVKSDPASARGERLFKLGDMSNLAGYEFNEQQKLNASFTGNYEILIDRAGGAVSLDIAEFSPEDAVAYLEGATHFKMVAAVAEIDWDTETYVYNAAETAELEFGNQVEAAQSLGLTIPAGSTKTVLVTFGLWFYQLVNGVYYALQDGSKNAMAIAGVDNP